MKTRYDALEELESKATQGPWKADFRMIGLVRTEDGAEITKGKRITSLVQLESNAQFIAAVRNAVPELIADLKALAEALQEVERADRIEQAMPMIEQRRWPKGANGIGVDQDADALEWQRLHSERGEILERRTAALSRIQEPK